MSRRVLFPSPLVTLAAVIALAGCGVGIDIPTGGMTPVLPIDTAPSGEVGWPDSEPESFAQDVERAASEVVGRYLAMTDRITSAGGVDSSLMSPLTTSTWFPTEQRGFDHYVVEGIRTTGTTQFHSLVVQSVWQPQPELLDVNVVACVDATEVWLIPVDAPEPPEGLPEWVASDATFYEGDEDQWEEWTAYLDTFTPTPGVVEAVVFWLVGRDLATLRVDGTANWEGGHSCHVQTED